MFFDYALSIALVIFAIGLIHKIDSWFLTNVGSGEHNSSIAQRFKTGLTGILTMIFSARIFRFVKVFVLDVLLQVRILTDRRDPLAWIMHLCLFLGFVFLLIFHAMGSTFAVAVDPDYQSTLNPFMLLRNVFGALALFGLVLAVLRRAVTMRDRVQTNGKDVYVLAVVALILFSGFLLEGLKITSHQEFMYMVEDYGDAEDIEATKALEAYWVDRFGVVSPTAKAPFSTELLSQGETVHEDSCMQCHSQPQSAFVSYGLSRLIKPFAVSLDKDGVRSFVWYVHILACFVGLALLPFTKFFHIISTPVSLIIAEVSANRQTPTGAVVRNVIERDGCSHGGLCHETCPVRRSRLERIQANPRYDAIYAYMDTRSGRDLGSREAQT